MTTAVSADTQATLLLTAPLATTAKAPADPLLKPAEFRKVQDRVANSGHALGDFLGRDASPLIDAYDDLVPASRLNDLLGRGFRLAQALDQWSARSIWVIGVTDEAYPSRLRTHFGNDAPPLLYGCGNPDLLETGGLAVVGSRDCDEDALVWTTEVGRRAARSRCQIVSGGARGVDITAMAGALEAGGTACGVLADTLFRDVLDATYRDHLQIGTLVLISPNDPRQRFFAPLRMQRNKYVYALSDSALVVATGFRQGGTWAGADEQLRRLRHVPVYVRVPPQPSPGLSALERLGAHPWPEPATPSEFARLVRNTTPGNSEPRSQNVPETSTASDSAPVEAPSTPSAATPPVAIQRSLFDV